jgi:hypothetical protein
MTDSTPKKHERRVVGHVSGWKEQMDTCVCGEEWPCAKAQIETSRFPKETTEALRRWEESGILEHTKAGQRGTAAMIDNKQNPGRIDELLGLLGKFRDRTLEWNHHHGAWEADRMQKAIDDIIAFSCTDQKPLPSRDDLLTIPDFLRNQQNLADESKPLAQRIADRVVGGVGDLTDYTSPSDQPDLMQCTAEELHAQVVNAVEAYTKPSSSNEALVDELISMIDEARRDQSVHACKAFEQTSANEINAARERVLVAMRKPPSPVSCGWSGDGRGQCLLRYKHIGDHVCERDGRLLLASQIRNACLEAELAAKPPLSLKQDDVSIMNCAPVFVVAINCKSRNDAEQLMAKLLDT